MARGHVKDWMRDYTIKNNSIVVLKSNDIGYDINNLINCVSYYTNIPGYIDEASDCNLTNYP